MSSLRQRCRLKSGRKRLLEDEVRIINWVSGPGWQADASAAADRLANRLGDIRTGPPASSRGPSKEQIYSSIILMDWPMPLRSKNALDDTQRGLLFDVLGVPLPLRDGNRRVPAAGDGPALSP